MTFQTFGYILISNEDTSARFLFIVQCPLLKHPFPAVSHTLTSSAFLPGPSPSLSQELVLGLGLWLTCLVLAVSVIPK